MYYMIITLLTVYSSLGLTSDGKWWLSGVTAKILLSTLYQISILGPLKLDFVPPPPIRELSCFNVCKKILVPPPLPTWKNSGRSLWLLEKILVPPPKKEHPRHINNGSGGAVIKLQCVWPGVEEKHDCISVNVVQGMNMLERKVAAKARKFFERCIQEGKFGKKNLPPPSLTLKKILPPLWPTEKKLPPL